MNNGGWLPIDLGNDEMSVRASFDRIRSYKTFQNISIYSDDFSLFRMVILQFETRNQFSSFPGTTAIPGCNIILLLQLVYILQFSILPNAVRHIMSTFR